MSDIMFFVTEYDFIWRALIAGLLITVCASLIGVTLVLKRLSMIGDGLSHISFGAVAIASVLSVSPLYIAVPVSALASVLLMKLGGKMKGDSGIAVISSSFLAIGIVLIALRGTGADINNYLIGSLYSVTKTDLIISICLCVITVIFFVLLHNRIFTVTFDEEFSKATGVKTNLYLVITAVLTSLTVVMGMRLMGALLISASLVFPALCSMKVFKSFLSVTILSVVISICSFLIGFIFTITFDSVPTGACITIANLIIFVLFSFFSFIKKR